MKNILVTGGAGFIGANFVKYLLRKQRDILVVNYDALTYAGNLESLSDLLEEKRHIFIHGDIRDQSKIEKTLVENQIEGVINFAAESHVDRSIDNPGEFIQTNVVGTLNLLATARKLGIKRFLQISTDEVYGSLSSEEAAFTEDTQIRPNSPYSASKASADHLVRAYHHTFGMDTLITRCSNNYGPLQFPEKMIPLCINNAFCGKKIPVYGDGMQIRDWLYVEDHCEAIWKVFLKGKSGEVYNIGGDNQMTNIDLVRTILKTCGRDDSLISFVKDRPGHDRRYAINFSKIKKELDWKPKHDFASGIVSTVKWYSENREWLDHLTSGEYKSYYEKMYSGR
ncbi:MAG TPA: dTDP-glucose 4,6-dehydratase [Victivallales bacterium]|nr:dTDP-glucose 4,6-dehydratase [Victivallales bacterium]